MSAYNEIWGNLQRIVPALNTSASGIIHRISEVVGTFIDIVRLEMLRSEQTITEATRIARTTTQRYYIDMAYYYQEGDNLTVINQATQELGYATIDASKKIIKQASIGLNSIGVFFLNAATADNNKNVIPLTQAQLEAFRDYYQNFIAMGAQCTVASNEAAIFTANQLTIRFEKTYNLEFIKASLNTALHDLQLIPRTNSKIYVNEIESYLTGLEGVRDAYFTNIQVQYRGSSELPEDGSILLVPGYFNFDPAFYDFTQNKTVFEAV